MGGNVTLGRKSLALVLAILQVVLPLVGSAVPRMAWAAPAAIETARAQYERAQYDEAIKTLDEPLQQGTLKGADLQTAEALTARCYVKKGMPEVAKEHFKKIMRADCKWTLDARLVPTDEYAVYQDVRGELPVCGDKGKSKTLWYVVAGAAVVITLVAVLAGPSEYFKKTSPPLPAYPGTP